MSSRVSVFSSPYLLGFGEFEKLLDRATKSAGDGYPPYNIERIVAEDGAEHLRITVAVAGFLKDELEISVEDNKLDIRGKQAEDGNGGQYLHRGIATRQFQRSFVLADGVEVTGANMENGLLSIDLYRRVPEQVARKIKISTPSV